MGVMASEVPRIWWKSDLNASVRDTSMSADAAAEAAPPAPPGEYRVSAVESSGMARRHCMVEFR